jgi:flagellar biosynthesis protein FlhA
MEGHTGPDAAGKVIEAFGHFLVGGNYAVGLIVFIILVVINFVVITKGAGRIAEVSARFTLDAMPGKQMAIDADLNAGLIGEDEARRRRAEIAQEADFYGSMDGAAKFVRGDAVAGIIIMLLNIIGGLIIGVVQHDMAFADAAQTYTLLTIGDGLVAQIPALIISTAAGMVVSRVSSEQDLNQQLLGQVFAKPQAVFLTAGILALLGIIPGMPHVAFLLMAAVLTGLGFWLMQRQAAAAAPVETQAPPPAEEPVEVGWHDVTPVDRLGLEVGYRLVPLVDRAQDGELLRRVRGIRKKIAQELGFLVPPVHIRDNLQLKPGAYRITLKGVTAGEGEVIVGKYLAINPGRVMGTVQGQSAVEPAYGLPAVWIDASQREQAQTYGYTVVDAGTVVATHLSKVINDHAPELLGREETQQLLDHVAKQHPKLVEDLVPKLLPVSTVQKVLQMLLEERVHLRDMRTILETLAEHAPPHPGPGRAGQRRQGRAGPCYHFRNLRRSARIAGHGLGAEPGANPHAGPGRSGCRRHGPRTRPGRTAGARHPGGGGDDVPQWTAQRAARQPAHPLCPVPLPAPGGPRPQGHLPRRSAGRAECARHCHDRCLG